MLLSAYGDSITAAYGLLPAQGFVPKLANRLSSFSGNPTHYFNFGQDGMTSWDLASAFRDHADWRDGLGAASAICILIGGDDLIQDLPVMLSSPSGRVIKQVFEFSRRAYASLLGTAATLKKKTALLAVGTLYNPFPQTSAAVESVNLYNETIIVQVARQFGVPIAPVHEVFAGSEAELIRGYRNGEAGAPGKGGVRYPVHPNPRGQSAIATAFASTLDRSSPRQN